MNEKFGKSNRAYVELKNAFLDRKVNAERLRHEDALRAKYLKQPKRLNCVVCSKKLTGESLEIRGIKYTICVECSHFNGAHEDTDEFVRFLYGSDEMGGATIYGDADRRKFDERVKNVYLPKVDFLIEQLKRLGQEPEKLSYADIGAGAGHFVAALRKRRLKKSLGYEYSEKMVSQANRHFRSKLLHSNTVENLRDIVASVEVDVATMIFSLEHVSQLRLFLSALRENKKIKWFFFAVPMFNSSTLLDSAFKDQVPRSVGFGHTHLFTVKSLKRMYAEFGMAQRAAWWFGGNAFDLYRMISMNFDKGQNSEKLRQRWLEAMAPLIDPIQLEFDKARQSSEVHVLAEVFR